MPLSNYYGGHGQRVMDAMRAQYGDEKKAKQVFYALANKRKQESEDGKNRRRSRALKLLMNKP